MLSLMNARTGRVVASDVEVACTRAARRRGLLGRDGLDPMAALLLSPCLAVHTAFMHFPIDVAFIDEHGAVVKIVRNLPPWRAAVCPSARTVVEFAAGALVTQDLFVGDRLYFASVDVGADGAVTSTFSFNVDTQVENAARLSASH